MSQFENENELLPDGILLSLDLTGETLEEDVAIIQERLKNDAEVTVVDTEEDDYQGARVLQECFPISFIEFAILNEFLYDSLKNPKTALKVRNYGTTDGIGRIYLNGEFNIANSWWFQGALDDVDNEFMLQTKMYLDGRKDIITEFIVACKKGVPYENLTKLYKRIKSLAFNNSKYTGKCIKVKLRDSNFRGIEIIDISNFTTDLILSTTQVRWLNHFKDRVKRGGHARYLLNGEPGPGKTESIRDIVRTLMPQVTFIIPEFTTSDDLTVILEACEIFDNSVIIMDDIDLYLGSRDHGGYTQLLGQFLSFFDGVKKRKISLLASTNDKGLVDKAAERPGRFNMTLDYTFLEPEQLVRVCNIHLPVKYQIAEVYDALMDNIDGKKVKITGAFIANLADNIKEMEADEGEWSIDDAVSLIKESYKGFYMSQVEKSTTTGFKIN